MQEKAIFALGNRLLKSKQRQEEGLGVCLSQNRQHSNALVDLNQETGQVGIQKEETCCFFYNKMNWTN